MQFTNVDNHLYYYEYEPDYVNGQRVDIPNSL